MARHALPLRGSSEHALDVQRRVEHEMPDDRPEHDREDEIRLRDRTESGIAQRERRDLTLYVMNTSMRKNDRKTEEP